ncbi:hypothetical protein Salat_1134400 [Sesamum alatum]|uniref:Uncharacterized protein n=1 Tax=Sesamum alatum TaxID=300844 RepID=A0AAE1YE00_9LAMI|nr:hypothetical protein Salat_1134400 [Sesamum alatum]
MVGLKMGFTAGQPNRRLCATGGFLVGLIAPVIILTFERIYGKEQANRSISLRQTVVREQESGFKHHTAEIIDEKNKRRKKGIVVEELVALNGRFLDPTDGK